MRLLLAALLLLAGCFPGLDAGGPDAGPTPPPTADAQAWLDAQNAVRRDAQPAPSSPLPPLTWSTGAAAVAQAWAAGCVYKHNAGRGDRGENIAAGAPPGSLTMAKTVSAWAAEVSDYSYSSNTCATGKECGHYTQLVWRDTIRAGCAQQVCHANSPFPGNPDWDFFVCDYEPPGNVVGQRPY